MELLAVMRILGPASPSNILIVKDATGAIIGATVMEKGSNNGAVTNINGEFTLNGRVQVVN